MSPVTMRIVCLLAVLLVVLQHAAYAQPISVADQPGELSIRAAGEHCIRVTLRPLAFKDDFPFTPAVDERSYPSPAISLRAIHGNVKKKIGSLTVEVMANPLRLVITNAANEMVQQITLHEDGRMSFLPGNGPVLGMGEGGPKPTPGKPWRDEPIQFDRRGSYDSMQPRWQAGIYGSRNPVPLLVGTAGWALFVASPWVEVDLRQERQGYFIPWKPTGKEIVPQTVGNQSLNQGKGLPPIDKIVPGLYDFFVFDAHDPVVLMKEIAAVSGAAVLPPKWAYGYMQSHRLLESKEQMTGIVDSFRSKKIPVDAVIYLGTGFTPQGWNSKQPSFEFNPVLFRNGEPEEFVTGMHTRNAKVVLHMVPWDRDLLPDLHGSIPAKAGEPVNRSHIQSYWQEHVPLVNTGIDGWWPDEGDWFNLYERMKRHELYYSGALWSQPGRRPWSLHRNGFLGIARWGGWVWSGDTESSWKTLQGQIAVGINHSLSLSPFWGSDIGGFTPNEELTGELYARWFQFGAFNAPFRSHGRTWWTRLPWGWGLPDMGPKESNANPLPSEMNNPLIEPVTRKYDELHYQLLPYTYTLAWEARSTGMPPMRALWLHYPHDPVAAKTGDEFLWGRDMLIAPVYEKGAASRAVYLPAGDWYDWWDQTRQTGGKKITRRVDLATMPIYVRAGAIIPFDPVRQYTGEKVAEPTTLKVFTGASGSYTLYDDDGESLDYLKGVNTITHMRWNEGTKELTIEPEALIRNAAVPAARIFRIELIPQGTVKQVSYSAKPVTIKF